MSTQKLHSCGALPGIENGKRGLAIAIYSPACYEASFNVNACAALLISLEEESDC